MLGRPTTPRTETVNDLDAYLANLWRALAWDPDGVAEHADWPVNEADLYARHQWLVEQTDFREKMRSDPEFYDARIAGWWVWGISMWIGSGWCPTEGPTHKKRPAMGGANEGRGVHGKRPHLGGHGHGVGADRLSQQLPSVTGTNEGRGVHGKRHRKGESLAVRFTPLTERLRNVRVCCGDWTRVLTPAVTTGHGITGVVLDPPYAMDQRAAVYSHETDVSAAVREWAIAHGDDPQLRIVLCGYEDEVKHAMPSSWRVVEWKAAGGYGGQGDGSNVNANKERLWFSPACLAAKQGSLFA